MKKTGMAWRVNQWTTATSHRINTRHRITISIQILIRCNYWIPTTQKINNMPVNTFMYRISLTTLLINNIHSKHSKHQIRSHSMVIFRKMKTSTKPIITTKFKIITAKNNMTPKTITIYNKIRMKKPIYNIRILLIINKTGNILIQVPINMTLHKSTFYFYPLQFKIIYTNSNQKNLTWNYYKSH